LKLLELRGTANCGISRCRGGLFIKVSGRCGESGKGAGYRRSAIQPHSTETPPGRI